MTTANPKSATPIAASAPGSDTANTRTASPGDAAPRCTDYRGPIVNELDRSDAAAPAEARLAVHRGRVVFRARRPAALVVPLAAITEIAGVLFVLAGATIGWFIVAAPIAALLVTTILFRPTLELTRDGLVQRQYPFSSLTRWDVIESVGITRAGNRMVLGYRLVPGTPPPRRQPAAALLRAAGAPYDGGYFADSLASPPDVVQATVRRYLEDPALRGALPAFRR